MIELTEVLRLWREGLPKKRLAAQLHAENTDLRESVGAATEYLRHRMSGPARREAKAYVV